MAPKPSQTLTDPPEAPSQQAEDVNAELPLFFLEATTAKRHTIFSCPVMDLTTILTSSHHTCERLVSPRKVKPYFDSESYHDSEPSPEKVVGLFNDFKSGVQKVFASQAGGPEPCIITATRHGIVRHKTTGKEKFKVSFRAWVLNYKVEYTLIKDAIIAAGCSSIFDTTPYKSAEQLLCCINCAKTSEDNRVLTPSDPRLPPSAYVVQHLEGEEVDFVLKNLTELGSAVPLAEGAAEDPQESSCQHLVSSHPIVRLSSTVSADATIKYLHLLSKHRWDDRETWRDIATILKGSHGEQLKDEWSRLSQLSSKYDAKEAELLWRSVSRPDFKGRRLTMGTLIMWATQDDPTGSQAVRRAELPLAYLESYRKGDHGLAEMAYMLMADRVKRCGKQKTFYWFNQEAGLWQMGERDMLLRPFTKELEAILIDIKAHYSDKAEKAKELQEDAAEKVFLQNAADAGKVITRIHSFNGISAVLSLAAPLFHDNEFEQQLDSVPHLLGVLNGVVDLRTGDLRDREPEDNIFTVVKVRYDPAAPTAFMDDLVLCIMADNTLKASFLQLLLGYGITGEVCEEVFAVFTGSGRNGKGVIMQVLRDLLGDHYFKVANPAIITNRKASNLDAERGVLFGARIANFKELEPDERLKTSEVQLLSGGDRIPATPKYKDPMVIKPSFLPILETNHMPELDAVITATMDRLVCVDFPVTFTDLPGEESSQFRRQSDNGLKDRLRSQLPGVLKWLVLGAMRWYATRNLKNMAPPEVKEFTKKYFLEQDLMLQFLQECCELGPEFRVRATELLYAYNFWAADKGRPLKDKQLAGAMRHKSYHKKPMRMQAGSGTVQGYEGLRLLPSQPTQPFTDDQSEIDL